MIFGADIGERSVLRLAMKVHRCQRRKARLLDIEARIQNRVDVDGGGRVRGDREPVGPCGALAVEQGVDGDGRIVGRRLHDPEMGEYRELFAFRLGGVDREAAGGQAVAFQVDVANMPRTGRIADCDPERGNRRHPGKR